MSLSSKYLNYLVWRYLQENGHALSALAIDKECNVDSIEFQDAPTGELVRLVLKGQQMCEIEADVESRLKMPNLTVKQQWNGAHCVAGPKLALGARGKVLLPFESKELNADEQVCSLAWGHDFLAVGTVTGQLRVWDNDATLQRVLNLHTAPISAVSYNKTGTHLVSADTNGVVGVWEGSTLASKTTVANFSGAGWIDARTLAISAGRSVTVYKQDLARQHTEFHTTAPVSCLRFDDSSQLLATGCDDGSVHIWHGRSQAPIRSLVGSSTVFSLVWLPNPLQLAASAADPTITSRLIVGYTDLLVLWDVSARTQVWSVQVEGPVIFIEVKKHVAVASAHSVTILSLDGELLAGYKLEEPATGLLWTQEGLICSSSSKTVIFNDL